MRHLHLVAPDPAAIVRAVGPLPEGVAIVPLSDKAALAGVAAEVEALVCFPHMLDQALVDAMPRLGWLQTLTAGVDPLIGLDLGGVTVTSMSGVQAPQMSEHAFFLLLALARDIRGTLAAQDEKRWAPAPPRLLAGSHLVIVGVGRIAGELAIRAQAFGMRVTGISAAPRDLPGFDAVRPREELADAAAEADQIVVLSPDTPANRGLVSRAVLARLRPHAILVSMGRGTVVDEAALAELLAQGRIAGAGLDVFAVEPLPADSPLWHEPRAILTPHVGGRSPAFVDQVAPVIAENARHWFAEPPLPLRNCIESNALR
ncbi:MAG: D-2-hydroxyacid dehydrogenase [Sphingomonas fennica]